jgi:hypothetical protein
MVKKYNQDEKCENMIVKSISFLFFHRQWRLIFKLMFLQHKPLLFHFFNSQDKLRMIYIVDIK